MTRAPTARPVPAWFTGLIDDAALFPPGNTPIAHAVPAHGAHTAAWYGRIVGPFLCPDQRLPELGRQLDAREEPEDRLDLGLIITGGAGAIASALIWAGRDHRLALATVEVALRDEPDLARNARRVAYAFEAAEMPGAARPASGANRPTRPDPGASAGGAGADTAASEAEGEDLLAVPISVEVPPTPGWESALDVLAETGYRAKLRTGGPDGAPAPADVARFVLGCLDREVPFKCTAGLHHAAARTGGPNGSEHGFLNLLLATRAALDGADEAGVVDVLGETDGEALATRLRTAEAQAAATRAWFTSFGSCSITEPLADLEALHLLSP